MPRSDDISPERVEQILQRLDALPTLSSIAVRLLSLSSSDAASINEIARLVESDPALTTMLLSMCRRASTGLGDAVTTVDRAVVMLGLEAVRSALLSVHVYELMEHETEPAGGPAEGVDRAALWRRQLAAACASERLARELKPSGDALRPEEAFTAGLLHGLGKLALASVLPKTYRRVANYAELRRCTIAEAERELIGIDHHTAGKRLGERWGLPLMLQDVMWLYGSPAAIPPDLPHTPLIRVVSAGVALARALHIGWGGDGAPPPAIEDAARAAGLDPARVEALAPLLHDDVARRAAELGLDDLVDADIQLQSIAAANRELARLNRDLERRARATDEQAKALAEVAAFHAGPSISGVPSAYEAIARSAARVLGEGYLAICHQSRDDQPWTVAELARDGRVRSQRAAEPPPGDRSLRDVVDLSQLSVSSAALLGWLADALENAPDLRTLRLLPLLCPTGEPALLLHDRDVPRELLHGPGLAALTSLWSGALGAASRHDGARRLQETIADVNRRLVETQEQLTEAESLARLGRMTAGAAHEMNNPLAIISGRAQVLAKRAATPDDRAAVAAIQDATARLSELISGLHFFADPPSPSRAKTDITDLLSRAVADVKRDRAASKSPCPAVKLTVQGPIPPAYVDGSMLSAAVTELLQNAMDASPEHFVELRAETAPADGRLVISISDLGRGMDRDTLKRATEPFFSRHDAGRRAGLGLSRARRLAEVHGGRLELSSAPEEGTVAALVLPRDAWCAGRPAEAA